ncbi:hypothetical protein [Mycobacterium sp. OTB74]|uniref:hypothetical protein n=1 Tax=Mycobacterium sp. OTB74 TaxID=1853452 RepID=UPI002473FFAC|nr:hypothetical protein [Mycobacterium sp. OTB74]MDH6243186.1 hypothetical protein [Mycobacterium sp. OTB74]
MATLKKIASTAAMAVGLGAAVFGLGSGVASAAPAIDPGMISMDHGWGGGDDWDGHGHGGWHGGGWHGGGWGGGWGPSVYITPPCVTGPFGYVTACA